MPRNRKALFVASSISWHIESSVGINLCEGSPVNANTVVVGEANVYFVLCYKQALNPAN